MANIAINLRTNEQKLEKGGNWRETAAIEAASGKTLAPLNPLPVGESFAKVIEVTKAPARNRPDFFIYRAHFICCSADGSTLYLPGTTTVTDNEKQALFSISMTVDNILFCDDHRGEVVSLNTTAGRTANNTVVNKTGQPTNADDVQLPKKAKKMLNTAQLNVFKQKFVAAGQPTDDVKVLGLISEVLGPEEK